MSTSRLAAVALAMADNEERTRGQVDRDAPQCIRPQRCVCHEFGDHSDAAADLDRMADRFVRWKLHHHLEQARREAKLFERRFERRARTRAHLTQHPFRLEQFMRLYAITPCLGMRRSDDKGQAVLAELRAPEG